MARSAVVVVVRAVDSIVGVHRMRHDPMAARGVPAHITILFPFRFTLDAPTLARINEICRRFAPFETTLATVGRFPGGAVRLRPEPDNEFIALTGAFVDAFPDCPPYGGEFDEIIPHLTVAIGLDESDAVLLQTRLASQLPVSAPVDQVTLLVEDDVGMWHVDRSWPLLPDSSPRHL